MFGGVAGATTGADAASVDDGGDAVGADDEGSDAASGVPAGVVEEVVAMGVANRWLTASTKTGHQPHRYTHGLYLAVPTACHREGCEPYLLISHQSTGWIHVATEKNQWCHQMLECEVWGMNSILADMEDGMI